MSLTSILNDPRRTKLKQWFRFHFPNPGSTKEKIKVPSKTNVPGEVGTAFDYLMRFNIQRLNSNIENLHSKYWVATLSLHEMLRQLEVYQKLGPTRKIGYNGDREINIKDFVIFLNTEYNAAEENYNIFLKKGVVTKSLLQSVIFLAKLDVFYRGHFIDANIDQENSEIAFEVEKMYKMVPWAKFIAKEHCFLNPTFGKGSTLVGGADADLVIDSTLIDFKTTKDSKIFRNELNQIIGYYLLSILGRLNNTKKIDIEKVAVYYARHGVLKTINLADFFNKSDFRKRAKEFKRLVEDRELQLLSKKQLLKIGVYHIDENDFKCPYCNSYSYSKRKSNTKSFYYHCNKCKKQFSTNIDIPSSEE
jgi:hypothetical protein